MDRPKSRSSAKDSTTKRQPARKSTEGQAVSTDDVVLETYEQSPDRGNEDERSESAAPDETSSDETTA